MGWFRKDKPSQPKTPVAFTAQNKRRDLVNRTLVVHLELNMEYPNSTDIVKTLRSIKTNYELPPGVQLNSVHMSHIEILGGSDYAN